MRETAVVVMVTSVLLTATLMPVLPAPRTRRARLLTLYHYTSPAAIEAIRSSGTILQGTRPTLRFGPGVYFTPLPPRAGKTAVGTACYGPRYGRMSAAGRLRSAVVVEMPASQVEEVRKNVFVYRGDLNLGSYSHSFVACEWPPQATRRRNTRPPRHASSE